ncbi:hypothetical protein ABAC402_13965 [Asticcacaulis sp. AC402]|nr:hypothetical protein ABAC402_13965 [Asticcacaulis sp. AC402]
MATGKCLTDVIQGYDLARIYPSYERVNLGWG